jgi:hypothetical protein
MLFLNAFAMTTRLYAYKPFPEVLSPVGSGKLQASLNQAAMFNLYLRQQDMRMLLEEHNNNLSKQSRSLFASNAAF